jgi:TatD DNase family protein
MTLRLFDTHAHLNSEAFNDSVDEVVARAKAAGVEGIGVIGIDVATSRRACELAAIYPGYLHAVVGIQPNSAGEADPGDFAIIEELVKQPGVVGIGETGLDCYWDDTPMVVQQEYFQHHLDLAVQRDLPVVIHMRESASLIIERFRAQKKLPPIVMHSFTGDVAEAKACLDLGLMISFAGMVTFKKSDALREVAAIVPLDRLLIETDSPYLSPEPFRGKRPNEPARVEHTLRCLAQVHGMVPEELAGITTDNARRFFRI